MCERIDDTAGHGNGRQCCDLQRRVLDTLRLRKDPPRGRARHLAVEAGYRGYFTTADNLCRTLVRASIEGNLTSKMKTFTAPTVLVIDDVGLLPIGGTEASAVFFQVVNTRYEKGHPTLVTTNRSLPDWGTIFGDAVVAAAVLDRLMHNAIVFNIKGPSWRLREHNGLEIATTIPGDGGAR